MHRPFLTVLLAALVAGAPTAFAKGTGHSSSHAAPGGSHGIKGHTKKNGTYVAPAHAKNPNKTKRDNYSSKGNTNPRTGKAGTKDPDKP